MKVTKFFQVTLVLLLSINSYKSYGMLKRQTLSPYGTLPYTGGVGLGYYPYQPETKTTERSTQLPKSTDNSSIATDQAESEKLLELSQNLPDLTEEELSKISETHNQQNNNLTTKQAKEKQNMVEKQKAELEKFDKKHPGHKGIWRSADTAERQAVWKQHEADMAKLTNDHQKQRSMLQKQQEAQIARIKRLKAQQIAEKQKLTEKQKRELDQFDKEHPGHAGVWKNRDSSERQAVWKQHEADMAKLTNDHQKEINNTLHLPSTTATNYTLPVISDKKLSEIVKKATESGAIPKEKEFVKLSSHTDSMDLVKKDVIKEANRLPSNDISYIKRGLDWLTSHIGMGALGQAENAAISIAQNRQSAEKLVPALRPLSAIQREDVFNAWLNVWKQKASQKGFDESKLQAGIKNMIDIMEKSLPKNEHLILVVREQPSAEKLTAQELYFEIIGNTEFGQLKSYPSSLKYGNIEVYYKEKDIERSARDYLKQEAPAAIQQHRGTIAKVAQEAIASRLKLPKLKDQIPTQPDKTVEPTHNQKAKTTSNTPTTALTDATLKKIVDTFINKQVPGTSSYIQDTISEFVIENIKQQVQHLTVANISSFLQENAAEIKKAALDLATPIEPGPALQEQSSPGLVEATA